MSVREEEGEGEGEGEGDQWEEGGGVGGEATGRLTRRSRFRKWHPTNANEMKEFLTIILTDYTPLILCVHARARRKCAAGFRNHVYTRGLRVPGVLARKRWNFYTLNLALL